MIRINLLPADDVPKTRVFKMPQFGAFVPVGILAAAIVVCVGTYFVQKRTVDRLQVEVIEAKQESQRLAPQIARIKQLQREREQLDKRLDAITELDQERYFRVHLLSDLAKTMPENCWLTNIDEVSPGHVEIQGITFSNFIVADFLRDLMRSDYYQGVDLVNIQRGFIQQVKVLEFTISASVGQPPTEVAAQL